MGNTPPVILADARAERDRMRALVKGGANPAHVARQSGPSRSSGRIPRSAPSGFRPDYIEHQPAQAVRVPLGHAYNRIPHSPERTKMMQARANYLDTLCLANARSFRSSGNQHDVAAVAGFAIALRRIGHCPVAAEPGAGTTRPGFLRRTIMTSEIVASHAAKTFRVPRSLLTSPNSIAIENAWDYSYGTPETTFKRGDLLVVDLDACPKHGDVVVMCREGGLACCRFR